VSEPAKLHDIAAEPPAPDSIARLSNTNRRVLDLMFGTQKLFLEEVVFVADELMDRTRTEAHLCAEFISKFAESHSVRDWGTMSRECSQHQIDFIRRDCDRVFRHGERVIARVSGLLEQCSRS